MLGYIKKLHTKLFITLSIAAIAMVALVMNNRTLQAQTTLSPGEVKVHKTIKAVDGKINTWDIELGIEARDDNKTSDTVLIIDRSGSMRGSRLTNAKSSAKSFVNKLLPSGNSTNRIALVSFAGKKSNGSKDIEVESTLVGANKASSLNSKIDSISASGGTFTQAAIREAATLLNGSTADYKNIVLLSDGEPTYSYKPNNPDSNLSDQAIGDYSKSSCGSVGKTSSGDATKTGLTYDYSSIVGCGSQMFHRYGSSPNKYYNLGNAAIDEANMVKSNHADYSFYTIALEAGSRGTPVLNGIASPGNSYTASEADLQIIFDEIAGKISASAKDVTITDVVLNNFKPVVGSASNGGVIAGNNVSWSKLQLSNPDVDGVRRVTRTVRIELSDNFAQTANQHLYETNASVKFEYKDKEGKLQSKSAPSPKVNPVLIKTTKFLASDKASASDSFDIKVLDKLNRNFGATFSGSNSHVSNQARESGTYKISEIISSGQYETTYEYQIGNNAWQTGNNLEIIQKYQNSTDSINSDNDIYVKVTNKAKRGSISLRKRLGDCTDYAVPASVGTAFNFVVKNSAGVEVARPELKVSKENCHAKIDINDLPQGTYTISELGATDYSTTAQIDDGTPVEGKTITFVIGMNSNLSRTITFNNKYSKQRNIVVNKNWVGGKQSDWKASFELWRSLGSNPATKISTKAISGNNSATWPVPAGDSFGNQYNYSVKEVNIPENYTASPDCSNSCTVGENNTVNITNSYASPKISVTATKKWIGGPAERPTIQFQLLQNGKVHREPVSLPGGTTSYTWKDLDKTNSNGDEYIYTVKEISEITNYVSTPSEDGLTITNEYQIPKINITVNKVWEGGPAERPNIKLQLIRDGENYLEEVEISADNADPTNPNKWLYTWKNLDKTDINGKPYVYTIEETSLLNDYHVSAQTEITYDEAGENGNSTITNTYTSPKGDITATKIWVGGPETKPTITLELWRRIADGESEKVDEAILENGTTTATWSVDLTDSDGREYIYFVREKGSIDQYETTYSEDELTVTNKYIGGKGGNVLGDTEIKPTIKPAVPKYPRQMLSTSTSAQLANTGQNQYLALFYASLIIMTSLRLASINNTKK